MMTGVAQSTTERWSLQVVLVLALLSTGIPAPAVAADGQDDTKVFVKPAGPALKGATTGKNPRAGTLWTVILSSCSVCRWGEHAFGLWFLSEGYSESPPVNVPSRCGSIDGGWCHQCQSQQMESSMPDHRRAVFAARRIAVVPRRQARGGAASTEIQAVAGSGKSIVLWSSPVS